MFAHLHASAHQGLKEKFDRMDGDHDGALNPVEFAALCASLGYCYIIEFSLQSLIILITVPYIYITVL